jgi:Na+-driven multidrug efflux pump
MLADSEGYCVAGHFVAQPFAEAIVALMYFLMFGKGDWKKEKV